MTYSKQIFEQNNQHLCKVLMSAVTAAIVIAIVIGISHLTL